MNWRNQSSTPHLVQVSLAAAVVLCAAVALTACSGISRPSVPDWVPMLGGERETADPSGQAQDPAAADQPQADAPAESTTASLTSAGSDTIDLASSDPLLPPRQGGLQPGATMRVAVYEGLRSTSRVLNTTLTVDPEGQVTDRRLGDVSVAGMSPDEALGVIETALRLNRPSAQATTTHLLQLNGIPVVQVRGAVVREDFLPRGDGLTLGEALQRSGGFGPGANPGKVYVIRRGRRELLYLSDEATMGFRLNEGDIVSVPWAL